MNKYFKVIFVIILIFSAYHFVRDIAQTFNWHTDFSNILHRSHQWCGQYCNYVTYPLDLAGMIISAMVLKRNRIGWLGIALLVSLPLWVIFTLLP